MVKIVPKFTKADIKKLMLQKKQAIIDAIVFNLNQIGENFVVNARSKTKKQGGFGDITGNLRSSIGYAVLYNGAVLNDNLEGTIEGVRYARKAIADIKKKYPSGFLLFVCAGMQYAAAVEANGRDVITGSSLQAESDLKKAIKRIQTKLK